MRTPRPTSTKTALRRRAEARLRRERQRAAQEKAGPGSTVGSRPLRQELQVHQVELEMQNLELQNARDRLEVLLEKYTDLYDFAPVGYFSLDDRGRILEVNLTGAALLGVDRSRLLQRSLLQFVSAPSVPTVQAFLKRLFAGTGEQLCEAALRREGGAKFWANLHGGATLSTQAPRPGCRVSVSDITSLKQAEEAQRRLEAFALANRELNAEIARRQAVEVSLRQSEQRQGQLLVESRQFQEQLRKLSHRLLKVQEEERKRISRELHDEIAQILVGIHVQLENLTREPSLDGRALRRRIIRTQRLVERSVDVVQQFARELRPASLDDLGLIASLHSHLKDFVKRTGLRLRFNAWLGVERLSSPRRIALYRVAHSALTNIARHAQASRVNVSLRRVSGNVCMEISDDGKGFEVKEMARARRNAHLGLLGMRERMEMVGGNLNIESSAGHGTTIRALIPMGKKPRGGKMRGSRSEGNPL